MWIIISMLLLATVFAYWGWNWERNRKRPPLKEKPLVSILIPAYKAGKHIEETILSAKAQDYGNIEILVANEEKDETNKICEKHGVFCFQNPQRMGKVPSINNLVDHAKGDIIFFLDSDTVMESDTITKIVPWFTERGIGAVAPKFVTKNKINMITRLASLENHFYSALFKIHMHFGSMISFRGCGVAIRKDLFYRLGKWSPTLIEDTDFAGKLLTKGYKIQYEPDAVIRTMEPETWKGFYQQRFRWGKGSLFSFLKFRRLYAKNYQFMSYILPYMLLSFAVFGFFIYQTSLVFLPLLSLYLIYTISIRELAMVTFLLLIPTFSTIMTSVTAGTLSHLAFLTYPEKEEKKDILLIIPYAMIYLPFLMFIYARGIISGIRDKKNRRAEMSFKDWNTDAYFSETSPSPQRTQ